MGRHSSNGGTGGAAGQRGAFQCGSVPCWTQQARPRRPIRSFSAPFDRIADGDITMSGSASGTLRSGAADASGAPLAGQLGWCWRGTLGDRRKLAGLTVRPASSTA